jgi:hypothetical protein
MAEPKQPSIDQMMAELRNRAVGPKEPLDPIGTAKRNLTGMYESAKRIPGNVKRMVQDPVAYAKSIPAPTGDQIMNALGPGNVGMAGIMIGPKAKTWHTGRAQMAEAMEAAGRTPEEIWYATGTYRGPGGAWRQEIDDSKAVHRMPYEIKQKAASLSDEQQATKAAIKESLVRGKEVVSDLFPKEALAARKAGKQRVSDIEDDLGGYFGLKADPRTRGNVLRHGYEHPELYAAYPELQDFVFKQGNDGGRGVLGSLDGRDVNLYLEGLAQKQPGSTVAHELQHAIQGIEGTPRGGNTYEFLAARKHAEDMVKLHNDRLSDLAKRRDAEKDPRAKADLEDQYFKEMTNKQKAFPSSLMDPYKEYMLLGGEAESRMIQQRLNMTPEERAQTFPMGSYDRNPKHLRLLDQGESIDIYKAEGGAVDGSERMSKEVGELPGIKHLSFEDYAPGEVELVNLEAHEKSKGHGTSAMHRITSAADKHKINLMLIPAGDESKQKRLSDFYGRFGFLNDGDVMRRRHKPTVDQMRQSLAKGGGVEVRPTVKDDAIQRKVPEMEAAARAVQEGTMKHKDYDKVVNKHKPVKPYTFVPQPASDDDADRALMENKKPQWRGHEQWPGGRKVGLRLDIPAYENHGVWVNSIHDEEGSGEDKYKTAYGPVSSVKNATFDAGPSKAIKVATGEQNKSPFARIKGELHHMSEDEAVEHIKKNLNHPDYAQVGMDPRRHGFFYDRKTLKPVTHAKHVVQIGPLVLAHKPTYGPRESYAEGGNVKPSVAQMKLALNQQGMYSPLEKAAMAVPRPKGTPAEFMAEISKQPGFRSEEVADRKITTPQQKMTKDEFLAHLQTHPSPRIRVKELSEEEGNSQYGEYQIPGGDNYREVLLKLPQRGQTESEQRDMMFYEADMRRGKVLDPFHQKKYEELKQKEALADQDYRSSHWRDDPNVLAHIRLSDREIPNDNGKHNVIVSGGGQGMSVVPQPSRQAAEQFAEVKRQGGYRTQIRPQERKRLLHVEEIQSDWHQQGREEGYKGNFTELPQGYEVKEVEAPGGRKEHRVFDPDGNVFASGMSAQSATRNAIGNLNGGRKVPEAPFKKSWNELAMKHVLNEAANGGYDGISITPGAEQAKRWQNEGLKVQYDKTLPAFLNKLGKPHGAQIQMNAVPVETKPEKRTPQIAAPGIGHFPPDEVEPAQTANLHYFPITDSLRQQIKTEGLPQYQRGGIIHKAEGGNVATLEQMKAQLMAKRPIGLSQLQSVGANEAPNLPIKAYLPPGGREEGSMMPVGGVDMNGQPGHQLMPQSAMPPAPQQGMPGAPGQPPMAGGLPGGAPPPQGAPMPGGAPAGGAMTPQPLGGSNILQMTPQGQAMAAMGGGQPPQAPPRPMAKGGSMSDKSAEDMKDEMQEKDTGTRELVKAEGSGGVKGIVVPHHMLHGRSWVSAKTGKTVVVPGMNEINKSRAKVYGSENRDPLGINEIGSIHKKTLEEHFAKSHKQQLADEKEALGRLRAAKHIHGGADTLDKSEKLDTVNHEYDEQGRSFTGLASKGVAGHALYTSGHGENEKRHVLNTCPGQTAGCGGGTDKDGIVDTSKGTCFAPNAESQYVHAAVRRACHEQAKHDPAMTKDWILAHTGALREAARKADRVNKRLLFRPNVVDETDVSSRHVIRHLNEQRKEVDKPPIVANSYGKTTELHDPENGYYVTHSNVGPKVKKGASIAENIARDQQRVRQTILGTKNKKGDDLVNAQGNVTPPKGSYMVTDVKRYSPFDKKMQGAITHAKYWSTGRAEHELSKDEKGEGEEGHFDGNGKPTTPDKAHYGHTTTTDDKGNKLRYDYQKQHILHPRLVNVPERKKNKKTGVVETVDHMIPTDSRFKDEDYLPKDRYKTKTGKLAGHILMTTPTESTDNVGHQTSFTHHVGEHHIEHALKHNGEYEIDNPKDQEASSGTEYVTPQPIKIMKKLAKGGSVTTGTDEDMDGHMAFPERSFGAQHRLSYRHDPEEVKEIGHLPYDAGAKNIHTIHNRASNGKVSVHKDLDTMAYELSRKTKAK